MFSSHIFKKQNTKSKAFTQPHFSRKSGAGFTIIELLVVIAIIGLISSVVLVSMKGSTGKAKIAKGLEFSQTIMNTIGHDQVGSWNFDEGSGNTVHDKSGYGNHGTLVGPPTWVDGEENTPHWYVDRGEGKSALKFDGNDYVEMGQNGPSSSEIAGDKLTIEAWVKPETLGGTQYIVIKNGPFFLNLSGNKLQGRIHPPWTTVTGKISLSSNQWCHCVLVYDGINISLYVNGKFDNSVSKTGNLAGNGCVQIGQYSNGGCGAGSNRFHGLIDEVRIYVRALGSSEIQQHYADGAEKHQLAINNR